MNYMNDICDEEFIPFLQTLGVETYKKSFEWMLNDPDFSGVLLWIYNNLDHNNALTTREECRYAELEKKERLLSVENLEARLVSIQDEFKGLPLAGDLESLEDVKLDINHLKDKLAMLQMQEELFKEMIAKKKSTKEDLTLDIARLNTVQKLCFQDVKLASDQCTELAEEVENIENSVTDVIAEVLGVYGSCMSDKEMSKQFFTFGPLESYRQSQSLFKSHFDLYTNKKFNSRDSDVSDDDLRTALIEAKNLEECLSEAVFAYIESKAELSGEQAKMLLVSNYTNVHPTQITVSLMEAQSAIELLEQEESILDEQLQSTVRQYAHTRTRLAVDSAATAALRARQQIYKDLTFLLELAQRAVGLDRLLYRALRRELRTLEEVLHFAAHLRLYLIQETEAAASRIRSMSDICTEQDNVQRNLQTSNMLVQSVCSILAGDGTDVLSHIKMYNELKNKVPELKENINYGFQRKEEALVEFKASTKPLTSYIYAGCTRHPTGRQPALSASAHRLARRWDLVDGRALHAAGLLHHAKKSDNHQLRKLWQWFLTDQARLLAAVGAARTARTART